MNTRALRRMAREVDEQHRMAMDGLPDRLEDLHFGETARRLGPSRRRFLAGAAAGGATVAVGGVLLPVAGLVPGAAAQDDAEEDAIPQGDIDLAVFAASVERAAVAAYTAAAARGLITEPALQLAVLFSQHHADHAGAFEGLLGLELPAEPNAALLEVFAPQIEAAADEAALLKIAFDLEQGAAATYQLAMGVLESHEAAAAVATIEPIEAQHAVVLGMALDLPIEADPTDPDNWMPAFQTDAAALSPETYAVPAAETTTTTN